MATMNDKRSVDGGEYQYIYMKIASEKKLNMFSMFFTKKRSCIIKI